MLIQPPIVGSQLRIKNESNLNLSTSYSNIPFYQWTLTLKLKSLSKAIVALHLIHIEDEAIGYCVEAK